MIEFTLHVPHLLQYCLHSSHCGVAFILSHDFATQETQITEWKSCLQQLHVSMVNVQELHTFTPQLSHAFEQVRQCDRLHSSHSTMHRVQNELEHEEQHATDLSIHMQHSILKGDKWREIKKL